MSKSVWKTKHQTNCAERASSSQEALNERTADFKEEKARRHSLVSKAMSRNAETLEGEPGLMAEHARPEQVRCTHGLNLQCSKRIRIEDLSRGPHWLQSIGCRVVRQ